MAENSIEMKFGADVGSLQSALASTSDALKSTGKSFDGATMSAKDFAKALAASGNDLSKIPSILNEQATAADKAGAALKKQMDLNLARNWQESLKAEAAAAKAAAGAHDGLSFSTARSRTELIVLAHEMAMGNYSRFGGSLMVLAEAMGGISIKAMAAAGGVAALGIGLYELVSNALEARNALDRIEGSMAAMGRGGEDARSQIAATIHHLKEDFDLGSEGARNAVTTIQSIPRSTKETRDSLLDLGVTFANVLNGGHTDDDQTSKVLGEIAKAASGGAASVRSFGEAYNLFNVDELRALETARQENDILGAQDVLKAALTRRTGDVAAAEREYAAAVRDSNIAGLEGVDGPKKPEAKDKTGKAEDEDARKAYDQAQALPAQVRQSLSDAKAEWKDGEQAFLDLSVETWKSVVAEQKSSGASTLEADRALAAARGQLTKQTGQDAISDEKSRLAQMEAASSLSAAQKLSAEAESLRRELALDQLGADEKKRIQTELNLKLAQLRTQQDQDAKSELQKSGEDAIANAKLSVAIKEASGEISSREQVLTATIASNQAILANAKMTAEQRRKVETETDLDIARLKTEQSKAIQSIEKADVTTDLEISRIRRQNEKEMLDASVTDHEMSNDEKFALLKQFSEDAYIEDVQRLSNEASTLEQIPTEYNRVYNEIRKLAAQHEVEMEKLAKDQAAANKKAADQTGAAWKEAVSPIGQAFDGALQGVLQGTQTVGQAMRNMGANIALSFAESIAKMMLQFATFKLFNMLGWTQMANASAASQTAMSAAVLGKEATMTATATAGAAARKGIGAIETTTHVAHQSAMAAAGTTKEATMTSATLSGNAVRTAADTASESTFLGRIATRIAAWLGFETGKTAATVSGDATQAAADTSATLASVIAAKAEAAGVIPVLAGEAGAGAYAATAAIPIIGPALAPAAASMAVMDTLSFLSVASAAGGWDKVPYDGALTELHRDEMVLSAPIANPLRSFLAGAQNMQFGYPAGFGNSVTPPKPANTNAATNSSAGGSAQPITNNFNIQAVDAAGFANLLTRSGSPVMNVIQSQQRNGATLMARGTRA